MKLIAGLFVICFSAFALSGQTVVLEVVPPDTGKADNFGPNRKHFIHNYIAIGMPIGRSFEGAPLLLRPHDFQYGIRYKLKLGRSVATGMELAYQGHSFRIKQEPGKWVYDTILYERERVNFGYVTAGAYLRLQPGPRGDVIGRHIDFGAKAGYRLHSAHFTRQKLDDGSSSKTTRSRLPGTEPFMWAAFARIGLNRLAVYFEYMGTRHFTANTQGLPVFPAYTLGLQLGFH